MKHDNSEEHERAAEAHAHAAQLHERAAVLQKQHADEMRHSGRTGSAERAEILAARQRNLALEERLGEEHERNLAQPMQEPPDAAT